MPQFSHLHVHTQFSLLDGASSIPDLYRKAVDNKMPAIAITDHGNMFGVFKFVAEAGKYNIPGAPPVIKPLVGCEFYLVQDRHKRQFTRDDKDQRFHQLLLAKNAEGYRNLVKLCSLGYIEGLYGKYPRIDKELLVRYHKGLIATSCCLAAEVPRTILRKGEEAGEAAFKWWLDLFGQDYYVELQRHNIPEQEKANQVLLKLAAKYNVKVIATNDSHYVSRDDYNAHDILLCINTGEKQSTPSSRSLGDEDSALGGKRFAFYNDQFYFKTREEMASLFSDLPAALENTAEIVDKIELLRLTQDIMLPHFAVPPPFTSQDEYLAALAMDGARVRYGSISPELQERINFELSTIRTMGFAGYFLIVSDFIKSGREMGVYVGPGRGSAAGSVVAYCTGITNIDPIRYNLLFERFLNPDRKSMPDIDTDFDDEGRQRVIDYVVEKYGRNQVAQIVTYGTMAARMSIKDVARVLDLPLAESNNLAKLVPERPGIELSRLFTAPIDGSGSLKEKEGLSAEEIENVKRLRDLGGGDDLKSKVLKEAVVLEGSVRGTGIHAAGIIIAPKDLTEIIPVCTSKETDLLITQYDGKVIEDAGVIKMDFLGLKTLTIIRDALKLISQNHGVEIDIEAIPLDDRKTFELYQRGETNATFQFESPGMQKYLVGLRPDKFEDLIAMNALYRPGPLEYIPNFIARKHGKETVKYDLPEMEEHLRETYGITVYQEQVMLLSQKLAGFTKGDADSLRKAMGKKQKSVLDKMKSMFMEGCRKNALDMKVCEKIWTDWEAFASYAFNKSHSTCYALVAFQTAYLKAHYPGEYMAAVLTQNLGNIDKITFFMEECRRMGIPVLGPDVNESRLHFAVNRKGEIRFGLGAVKGVGEAAAEAIIKEREANGMYSDIFDLSKRINLRSANKKSLESLVLAGAFDCFKNIHRAQYFYADGAEMPNGIEKSIRFGAAWQENRDRAQHSLFGSEPSSEEPRPELPSCAPWTNLEQLKKEKEVIGIYISGHPLDNYRFEISNFCSNTISDLKDLEKFKNREVAIAGIVTAASHKVSKMGKPFGTFTLEDYTDSIQLSLFSDEYLRHKAMIGDDRFLFIKGQVRPRFNAPDIFELKVTQVQDLSLVREKMVRSVTLKVMLGDLSGELVDKVSGIVKQNPGRCTLKFSVVDKTDRLAIELPSKGPGISLSDRFLSAMKALPEIVVKVA